MPGTCPCSPVQPRSPISSNQPPAAWTEAPAYQTASQPPCRGLGTAKVGPPAVPRPSATRGSNGRLDSRAQSVRSLTALWLGQDGVAATGGRWPGFLTVTGMVGVVTAVLAGIGLGCLVAVVLDRASALQVLLEDRLHVQGDRDLVADHHAATGQMVLPRHVEVVAVDRGRGREADPPQGAAVLLAHPVGRLPLPDVALRADDPVLQPEGRPVAGGAPDRVQHRHPVVAMDAGDEVVQRGGRRLRGEPADPPQLGGPADLVGGDLPLEAAEARDRLRLGELLLALPQYAPSLPLGRLRGKSGRSARRESRAPCTP